VGAAAYKGKLWAGGAAVAGIALGMLLSSALS
jgi:hypothetical protein